MLVLSRRRNQTIVIGDADNEVRVTVVEIRGDKIRLGIAADPEVPIHREEVHRKLKDLGQL